MDCDFLLESDIIALLQEAAISASYGLLPLYSQETVLFRCSFSQTI